MQFDYASYEYYLAAAQLVLAMFGMGVKLQARDFLGILRVPAPIGVIAIMQMIVAPMLAILLAFLLKLQPGIAMGMVLVTALPGGSSSNLFVYLGRGNVPLSISATTVGTLASLLATPLVLRLFGGAQLPAGFHMPVRGIAWEIGCLLLLPLITAMALGHRVPAIKDTVGRWCIRAALLVLGVIVVGSLTSGRLVIDAHGWIAPAGLVLLGVGSLALSYVIGKNLCGFSWGDSFTIATEVTVRNGNLGLLLKAALFPAAGSSPLADGVLYAVLFYSGTALLIAAAAAIKRRAQQGGRLAEDRSSV